MARRNQSLTSRLRWYAELVFSRRKVYFQEYPDLSSVPAPSLDPSITISHLRESDIGDFLALNVHFHQGMFRIRHELEAALDIGHRCYIARRGPELQGFLWIGVREVYSRDLNCRFLLDADQIVCYHGYVRPESRGQNILPGLLAFAFREASEDGFRRCYSYVLSTNEPSLRSVQKLAARSVGGLVCGFALGYYYLRIRTVRAFSVRAEVIGGPWFVWRRFLSKHGFGRWLVRPSP